MWQEQETRKRGKRQATKVSKKIKNQVRRKLQEGGNKNSAYYQGKEQS